MRISVIIPKNNVWWCSHLQKKINTSRLSPQLFNVSCQIRLARPPVNSFCSRETSSPKERVSHSFLKNSNYSRVKNGLTMTMVVHLGRRRRRRRLNTSARHFQSFVVVWRLLAIPILLLLGVIQQRQGKPSFFLFVDAKSGELASISLKPFTTRKSAEEPFVEDNFIGYRQNLCHRYQDVIDSNGTKQFKDALSGLEIHPVLQYGPAFPYFNYDPITGIDRDNPGVVANILDYIAKQANFTWRDSFAVYTYEDKDENKTWTQLLKWATDTYDISIDKWAQSTERLEMGVAFCDPWFDGSLIMVDKIEPPVENKKVYFGNWLLPFEPGVWWVTLATIIFSCLVYQFLELLNDERQDRTYLQWFTDNLYLGFINFTQNYSYEPRTLAGRVFGISFSFWAMLIGASYTANLASLLVERPIPIQRLSSIENGIDRDVTMCTHDKSFSDIFVQRKYGQAIRRPQATPEDMYRAVNNDECDVLIGTKQAWDAFQGIQEYNPQCYLEWVGRIVLKVDAAFATKSYPGVECTNLLNEVFNYYLSEMKDKGIFDDEWATYNTQVSTPNFNCNIGGSDESSGGGGGGGTNLQRRRRRQRQLSATTTGRDDVEGKKGRKLNGGGTVAAASAGTSSDGDEEDLDSLTLKQMAGTFLLHAIGSTVALLIAIYSRHGRDGLNSGKKLDDEKTVSMEKRMDALQSSVAELSNQMAMILTRLNTIQNKLDCNVGGGGQNDDNTSTTSAIFATHTISSTETENDSIATGKVRSFLTSLGTGSYPPRTPPKIY